MPIYDYLCSNCRHVTEVIHGINDAGPRFCPSCGKEGTMKKALSTPTVHFKGSGWAKKDRSSTSANRTRASNSTSATDGGSSDSSSSSSDSGSGKDAGSDAGSGSSSTAGGSGGSGDSSNGKKKPAAAAGGED